MKTEDSGKAVKRTPPTTEYETELIALCRKLKKDMKEGSVEGWDAIGSGENEHHVFSIKTHGVFFAVIRTVEGRKKRYKLQMVSKNDANIEVYFESFDYCHVTGKKVVLTFLMADDCKIDQLVLFE